jgi:hypothetical protein
MTNEQQEYDPGISYIIDEKVKGINMVKRIFLSLILLSLVSCTITFPAAQSFNSKVATQASVVLTATALDEYLKRQTTTPVPTTATVPTSTVVPTPTLESEDPIKSLGQPNWKDELTNAGNWFLNGSFISDTTKFYPSAGGIVATSSSLNDGLRWYLYFEKKPRNIYIEAKFDISTCSGNDQYGITFRAPNLQDGFAYFYAVTCGGSYNLRKWDTSGLSTLLENASGNSIHSGSNKTNVLGVWAKDSRIRLYVNGQFLQEISDSSLSNDGFFGLFINAKETPGFTIKLDEISYWLIN